MPLANADRHGGAVEAELSEIRLQHEEQRAHGGWASGGPKQRPVVGHPPRFEAGRNAPGSGPSGGHSLSNAPDVSVRVGSARPFLEVFIQEGAEEEEEEEE